MMNMSKPVGRNQTAAPEPVRVFLMSESRERIEQTIAHLCVLGFCEHLEWSDIMPKPDTGGYMSIMTKKR